MEIAHTLSYKAHNCVMLASKLHELTKNWLESELDVISQEFFGGFPLLLWYAFYIGQPPF